MPKTARLTRQRRLQRFGFESYREYLASPLWAAKKARYRASALPQNCVLCDEVEVHLHHITYERVCEEDLSDLRPVCSRCHGMVHALHSRGDMGLDFDGIFDATRADQNREIEIKRMAAIPDEETLQLLHRLTDSALRLRARIKDAERRGKAGRVRVLETRMKRIQRRIEYAKRPAPSV